MRKHLFGLVLTLLVAVSALLGTVTAEAAGNFVQVADTGVLELKSNQKWEKEYRTKMGDVKIRFRNLANSKEINATTLSSGGAIRVLKNTRG